MELDIENDSASSSAKSDHHSVETQDDSAAFSPPKANRKRRNADVDGEPSGKVYVQSTEDDDSYCKLLTLSDEVLLEILKNCNSLSLDAVEKTCIRFKNLVYDRRLWSDFDFSQLALSLEDILHRFKYINKNTLHFKIKGLVKFYPLSKWQNNTITEHLLQKLQLRCPQLETFEVYDGYLNFQKFSITEFPSTLKKLVFSGCEINFTSSRVFFNRIDIHMKHLQELSLENCSWFETHDLIMFSKLPNLKKLNLRGCVTLKECVPYGSIATRFGFRKLESLDIRNTPISDSDIQCFNITRTLRELFMECPLHLRKHTTSTRTTSGDREPANNGNDAVRLEANVNENENEQDEQNAQIAQNERVDQPQALQQDEQDQPQHRVPPVRPNENREDGVRIANHYINIVVRNHNYVDIQNDIGDRRELVFGNGAPLFVPNLDVNPQPQQLIIVRGLGCNSGDNRGRGMDRRNRISWEIVNHNNHQQYAQFFYDRHLNRTFEPPPVTLISDRGICSFGVSPDNVQNGVVWIRADFRSPDTLLETLVVRHYKLVTDVSLRHLINCSPKLSYLDVTGTSVTQAGIEAFKSIKPHCIVVSDFDV